MGNPIAGLFVVIVIVVIILIILTTPQTKDIHTYIHTYNSSRRLTLLLWRKKIHASNPSYLARYASSSFGKIKKKKKSQEAYLDTGLYTGRP